MTSHLPITLSSTLSVRTELVGNHIVGWFETPVLRLGDTELVPIEALERLTAPPSDPQGASEQPMLLTQSAAAKLLGVSLNTLKRLIKRGDIRVTKITDGSVRIARAELERYIAVSTHSSNEVEVEG